MISYILFGVLALIFFSAAIAFGDNIRPRLLLGLAAFSCTVLCFGRFEQSAQSRCTRSAADSVLIRTIEERVKIYREAAKIYHVSQPGAVYLLDVDGNKYRLSVTPDGALVTQRTK